MIDPQAYRIRIGMFCIPRPSKLKVMNSFQHDANAIALAIILTLLAIGCVELNPGPDLCDEHLPGPSFSDVTLSDVMQAIRTTQIQIDGVVNKVQDLAKTVTNMCHHGNSQPAHLPTQPTSYPTSCGRPCVTPASEKTTETEEPIPLTCGRTSPLPSPHPDREAHQSLVPSCYPDSEAHQFSMRPRQCGWEARLSPMPSRLHDLEAYQPSVVLRCVSPIAMGLKARKGCCNTR